MIRIEHEHSKIVYRAFFFKIINYEKMEFAKNSWKNKYETFLLLKNLNLKWYNFFTTMIRIAAKLPYTLKWIGNKQVN